MCTETIKFKYLTARLSELRVFLSHVDLRRKNGYFTNLRLKYARAT